MNRFHALSFATAVIALSALSIAAQAPPQHKRATLQASPDTIQAGCPVGLRAQRGTGSGLVVTHGFGDHGPTTGIAQQLHMTLTNLMPTNVIGVTLTAHGLTATYRMTPTVQTVSVVDPGTITRTVHLDLTLDSRAPVSTDLTLKDFTSVSRIDLDAIDYTDGSSWHASAQQLCHVVPDGLMLIGSR